MEEFQYKRTLQQLGLEEYIIVFEENMIDDESFLLLGKGDIKELLPIIGHRALVWNPEPDLIIMTYMKHNFGSDVHDKMKDTAFQRRTFIRKVRQTSEDHYKIMEFMPRLFGTEKMIVQDFNIRHPKLDYVIYKQWPRVSKMLFQYAEQSGINYIIKLGVHKPKNELLEEDFAILAFCLLPYILPSCSRKESHIRNTGEPESENALPLSGIFPIVRKKRATKTAGNLKKLKTVKAFDLDCLRSRILFKPPNTHVADVLSENKRKALFILALGSTFNLQTQSYFIIIQKVAVPCGTQFIVALDTCFKSYTVLSIPFPLESNDYWTFITHGIAGKYFHPKDIPSVVQALIGQIMPRV